VTCFRRKIGFNSFSVVGRVRNYCKRNQTFMIAVFFHCVRVMKIKSSHFPLLLHSIFVVEVSIKCIKNANRHLSDGTYLNLMSCYYHTMLHSFSSICTFTQKLLTSPRRTTLLINVIKCSFNKSTRATK
jgi:hypothetical protein